MMLAGTWRLEQRRQGLGEIDSLLLWSAVALVMLGIVMVFSASIAIAEVKRASATYYLGRHAMFVALGLVVATLGFQVPLRAWQRSANALFLVGLFLLAIVLIPGIGVAANGARRWIYLGVATLQPSELMKLFTVLYASAYVVRKAQHMDSIQRGFLPMAAALALTGGLLLLEPDFGAFAVITLTAMAILFLGGIKLGPFILLGAIALTSFGLLVWLSDYRRARLTMFLHPEQDPEGRGYQLFHSLVAFARGEWTGVGLGASVEKLFYLPEAHTDFLLAVIGEELGVIGVISVLLLFAVIVWRAFVIGREALHRDRTFSGLVAQGIGLWLGGQAIINMGVNLGVLPTKGLTLPLMSFGGSGIVANCLALAVLLRVDWETRQMVRGGAA